MDHLPHHAAAEERRSLLTLPTTGPSQSARRLYAAVLNARLMDFLEEGRLRAPTQAGFRPQLSIKHYLFALQHIIDRRIHRPRGQKKPLYCCFVDLTAAYDCVQPPADLGGVASVRHPRPHAGGFPVSVRRHPHRDEGCGPHRHQPALPHWRPPGLSGQSNSVRLHRRRAAGILGCARPGRRHPDSVGDRDELLVSHLMYADDIVLLGDSPADLQQLLDALSGFRSPHTQFLVLASRTPRQQVRLRIFRQRHSARRIGSYLRFRLGCSTLPVVMGRRDHTPRHRRHCQQCDAAGVGDERHMIFECPAVQHIRDQSPDWFWDVQSMREFVNQADQVAVMDCIVACFDSFVQTD